MSFPARFIEACIISLGILFILNTVLGEQVNDRKDWVKGTVVLGINRNGNCIYKPFVKVGIAEDNPDTGEKRILGFTPGSAYVNDDGLIIWERVDEALFIAIGRVRVVEGRLCQCPPYQYGGG